MGGVPPDYERLARLSRDHGLIVVEDGAEAVEAARVDVGKRGAAPPA